VNNSSFINKQFDVVAINVYKRSAEHDDVIFKPQKFIFDLSIFPYELENISAGEEEQFNRLIESKMEYLW
jgi:hypothetical protein